MACGCGCACARPWDQRLMLHVFLSHSSTYFLSQSLSLKFNLISLTWQAGWPVDSRICLFRNPVHPHQHRGFRPHHSSWFKYGCWWSNSGPHACDPVTLPTEPSPHPQNGKFEVWYIVFHNNMEKMWGKGTRKAFICSTDPLSLLWSSLYFSLRTWELRELCIWGTTFTRLSLKVFIEGVTCILALQECSLCKGSINLRFTEASSVTEIGLEHQPGKLTIMLAFLG